MSQNVTFEQLLQIYKNKNYNDLVAEASSAINVVRPYIRQAYAGKLDSDLACLAIIATTLAIDSAFSALEYKFICDIVSVNGSYDEIKQAILSCRNDDNIKITDYIFDNAPTDVKTALLALCLCIVTVDKAISPSETQFLKLLLTK